MRPVRTEGPVPWPEGRSDSDGARFLADGEMARTPSLTARHKVPYLLFGTPDQMHSAELREQALARSGAEGHRLVPEPWVRQPS